MLYKKNNIDSHVINLVKCADPSGIFSTIISTTGYLHNKTYMLDCHAYRNLYRGDDVQPDLKCPDKLGY